MATPGFASPQAEEDYIRQKAASLNLDPEAVLAVAAHEGVTLPAEVGDQGTSFGPWQLHAGGALPAQIWSQGPAAAQAWADSQPGIDYALGRIATVARGQRGTQAVTSIVYGFERPKDPGTEALKAVQSYQAAQGPSLTQGKAPAATGGVGGLSGPVGGAIGGAGSAIGSALSTPERAFRFLTSWRFAEVVGGFFLLLVGLVLLGRQFGLSTPAPPVVSKAADYSIFQAAPGAGSDAHFEANRAYVGSGGASRGDSAPGPRPVYSGRLPAGGVSSAGEIPF